MMNRPDVKIMALSNVYCRMMNFLKKGDFELGHYHTYDHGTLLSKGSLRVDILSESGTVQSTKIFTAPTFIYVDKDKIHRLTAIEDDTIACCIHALRTIDEEILDPDFLVEEKTIADDDKQLSKTSPFISELMKDKGMIFMPLAKGQGVKTR
jgi:hypothetical protein